RRDESGGWRRLLGAMTERLRAGAARLREAERRLAMGDLARQVNHDVKNGLIPIRNVFRHFVQAAREGPEPLAAAFRDRQATVESSITYLENLASNYARLYPHPAGEACEDRKSTRLNSSHEWISYAVFGLQKKTHLDGGAGRLEGGRGPHSQNQAARGRGAGRRPAHAEGDVGRRGHPRVRGDDVGRECSGG